MKLQSEIGFWEKLAIFTDSIQLITIYIIHVYQIMDYHPRMMTSCKSALQLAVLKYHFEDIAISFS